MSASTTLDLTMAQQAEAIQKIEEVRRKKRDLDRSAVTTYVKNVGEAIMFQPGFNWNDILSTLPISVMLLGSLLVASSTPDASQMQISSPSRGFEYLGTYGKMTLNFCLIQCCDTGVRSFNVIGKSMDAISLRSSSMRNTVNQIVMLLGDRESAIFNLQPTFNMLARTADGCKNEAEKIADAFSKWLGMFCELHACVVQASLDPPEKQAANQIQLAAAQTMPVSNQKAQEEARKITTALRDAFDMISRQYIKATEVIPPGWELIAADVVSNLSGCLTIAVNQAVPGLIDNYSTTVKLDNGMQIFGGDHGGASGGSAGYGKQDQSNVAPATRAPDPVPSAIPSYASDPAYGITSHALTCVGTVYSFVTGGTDHGVDWEGLASRDPSNQRNGLNVMTVLLKSVSSDFKPSQDPPSKDLSKVFTDVETVTTDLQTYVDKISVSGHKDLPTADTPEVKGWQAKMAAANALIIKLTTDARNITNIHSAPLVQTPDSEGNPADLKGGLRQQLINAATTKMTIAAEVMEASSVNYQKAIDKLRDTQTKLGAIQASLAGLTTSNISPDMTRAILVKCIDILVQLNSQINRLKGFFDAVSTLVARFADDQVGPFIRQLRGDVSMPEKRLAGFTHTDFQRQMIFSFCISIHAYFGLFRDITSMFKEVLVTNIMPGLDLVNDFSTRYNSAPKEEADKIVASKQKQLASHSQTATQNVTVIVGRQQSEVFDNLQANASDAANDLGLVSVRQPGDAQSAIEMSTSQGKQAAAKGIDKSDVYIGRQLSDNGVLKDD